jgi:SAM-dependent methyltransferase/tetratricopeptide (TPR) repeat protein
MSTLHFLESLSPFAHKKGWLYWEDGRARQLTCPACHAQQRMNTRRSIASPYAKHRRFLLYDCAACGSAHFPDVKPPVYEERTHGGQDENFIAPKKFYVEQGAGLEAMVAPFFWMQGTPIRSLLEVGCGYGFSLDFAKRAMGWTVQGMDPSHIARNGSEELGIPITEGYLNADTQLEGMPFDLVFSSEVIEHIADPDPFVSVLAMAAGKNGTVLLTTPDIAGLRQERPIEEVIPLLSPGSHLVLFSKDGLKACLKRAGFTHVEVRSTGDTLYAFASCGNIHVDPAVPVDRAILSKYLQDGMQRENLPHHLYSGYGGRLLRALTDSGKYAEAGTILKALHKHWQEIYKIDLYAPQTIETDPNPGLDFVSYADERPFNLSGVLYCSGVLALNEDKDPALALAYFKACARSYAVLEPVLTAINAADLESRALAHTATLLCAGLLTQTNPANAVSTFEQIDESIARSMQDTYRQTRFEVFAAAANTGDYESAERLRPAVEAALKSSQCIDEFERAAALGLAMIALNYRFERPDGLHWLQKALQHASHETRFESMRDVWLKHAAAHGVELLNHGGQKTFNTKRDAIAAAFENVTLQPEHFAIVEALGLAFMKDHPFAAIEWLEKALTLADDDHKHPTAERIKAARTHIFLEAVNSDDHDMAAKSMDAVAVLVQTTNDPGLHFALGLDALNRRCDLEAALHHFSELVSQHTNLELTVQGAFHLAMVQSRLGQTNTARETAKMLYSKDNPEAELVAQCVGHRQAELDAAINAAA